jgi:hypothetical protein
VVLDTIFPPIQAHVKMVLPIVAPFNPQSHDFNELESELCKEAFMQSYSFLVQWFLRFLNDIVHLSDYPHFDEDLALYLKNLAFTSSEDELYLV